jgi:hypothetical protein
MCIPLACIGVFGFQQFSGIQTGSATAAQAGTEQALASTNQAQQALDAALTKTSIAAATDQIRLGITATFLFDQALSLTLTAQVTPTSTASPIAPTETPTQTTIFFTATPALVTVTLRECRGDEGTVHFGTAQPQSINAYKTLSFTVPPGKYPLRIFWLRKKENNITTEVDVKASQTITFGADCR